MTARAVAIPWHVRVAAGAQPGRCMGAVGGDPDRRCVNRSRWSVLTLDYEMEVCGVHVRRFYDFNRTLAIEPLNAHD